MPVMGLGEKVASLVRIIVPTFFIKKLFMKEYMDTSGRWADLRGHQLTYGLKN